MTWLVDEKEKEGDRILGLGRGPGVGTKPARAVARGGRGRALPAAAGGRGGRGGGCGGLGPPAATTKTSPENQPGEERGEGGGEWSVLEFFQPTKGIGHADPFRGLLSCTLGHLHVNVPASIVFFGGLVWLPLPSSLLRLAPIIHISPPFWSSIHPTHPLPTPHPLDRQTGA